MEYIHRMNGASSKEDLDCYNTRLKEELGKCSAGFKDKMEKSSCYQKQLERLEMELKKLVDSIILQMESAKNVGLLCSILQRSSDYLDNASYHKVKACYDEQLKRISEKETENSAMEYIRRMNEACSKEDLDCYNTRFIEVLRKCSADFMKRMEASGALRYKARLEYLRAKEDLEERRKLASKTKTPFETLGLRPTATEDNIKKAYKALVVKYHPAGQPH